MYYHYRESATYIAREMFKVYLLFLTCNNFFFNQKWRLNVLRLADRVYHEMNSKEEVNA